jgi:hypothetical protein
MIRFRVKIMQKHRECGSNLVRACQDRVRVLAVLVALVTAGAAAADQRSEEVLTNYFAALGGRSIWAEGHGEYVLARVKTPGLPLPGTFELCLSWEKPQTADRARFQNLTQFRAFTGNEGWTFSRPSGQNAGELKNWYEMRMHRGLSEWAGNFEVLTHRLARRDEKVTTRMGAGPWKDWVEISIDSKVTAYLFINDEGVPRKFYRLFDDTSITFGPLAQRGNIAFPAGGSFDGGEPFDLIAFEILDTPPVEPFSRPDPGDAAYMHCR